MSGNERRRRGWFLTSGKILALVALALVGFLWGRGSFALSSLPGDSPAAPLSGPVVARSYLEAAAGKEFGVIGARVQDLMIRVDALEEKLDADNASFLPGDKGRVTAPAGLNVRVGPGTDKARLFVLPVETVVDLIGVSGDWIKVRTADGREGWVLSTHISLQEGK